MPRFRYKAACADGTIVETDIEGENEQRVRAQLEGQGLLVLDLQGRRSAARSLSWPRRSLSLREFLIFNQEFLALIKAGLSMLRTFDILAERTTHSGFHRALLAVREGIRGGASISDAMEIQPLYFSDLYRATIRSGEQAGNLAEVLQRYIAYLKLLISVREKVVKALAYPVFLSAFGLAVVGFLLGYVMPTFAEVYAESQAQLPLATQLLLNVIDHLGTWLPGVLVSFVLLGSGFYWWKRTPSGRWRWDWILLNLPLLGDIFLKNQTIRLTRTLATILAGGIPLLSALDITAKAMTNQVFRSALLSAMADVRDGFGLTQALKRGGFLPRMTLEMIEVGETTGFLESMLLEVAEFHEGELDLQLSRLTTWIEPALLLVMGVLVGGIVIVMYLPIFQLAGTV
ncbi:MAG: type II secretion system F family protein [Nitrospirae bacterium]|nr:MAG: type II secretion system F family protein [Nitrospirota bacterium]